MRQAKSKYTGRAYESMRKTVKGYGIKEAAQKANIVYNTLYCAIVRVQSKPSDALMEQIIATGIWTPSMVKTIVTVDTMPDEVEWVSVKDAAWEKRVCAATMRKWIYACDFVAVKYKNRLYIKKDETYKAKISRAMQQENAYAAELRDAKARVNNYQRVYGELAAQQWNTVYA